MRFFAFLAIAGCLLAPATAVAGSAPIAPPLLQSWSDTGLIGADDDWSRVPAVIGHRGDGLAAEPGADPRTVTADGSGTPVDVTANRTDPRAVGLPSGVTEFELADPVIAIQGSATASAPHLVLALDTRGRSGVSVRLVLRDIDASGADAVEPVAVQYRVGASGSFSTAPGGYVADATTGPGRAALVTPLRTTLPPDADDRALVQVRVITANAAGEDEWVGVDDISVSAAASAPPPGECPGPVPPAPPAPPATPPAPPAEPEPPALTDLALSPDTFAPSRRGAAIVRRGGVSLRFRLSRSARVQLEVIRASSEPGEPALKLGDLARTLGDVGLATSDVAPPRRAPANRGRFSVAGKRGLNRLRFSGRIRGRPLAPGSYILRAIARDRAGRASDPAATRFRITARRED